MMRTVGSSSGPRPSRCSRARRAWRSPPWRSPPSCPDAARSRERRTAADRGRRWRIGGSVRDGGARPRGDAASPGGRGAPYSTGETGSWPPPPRCTSCGSIHGSRGRELQVQYVSHGVARASTSRCERRRQKMPRAALASSDIISGLHGGRSTISGRTSPTPGTPSQERPHLILDHRTDRAPHRGEGVLDVDAALRRRSCTS